MVILIINLVERLENYKENHNSKDHLLLLRDLNGYVQKYARIKAKE